MKTNFEQIFIYALSRLSEEIPANRANVTGSFDAKNKTAETQGGNVEAITTGDSPP